MLDLEGIHFCHSTNYDKKIIKRPPLPPARHRSTRAAEALRGTRVFTPAAGRAAGHGAAGAAREKYINKKQTCPAAWPVSVTKTFQLSCLCGKKCYITALRIFLFSRNEKCQACRGRRSTAGTGHGGHRAQKHAGARSAS